MELIVWKHLDEGYDNAAMRPERRAGGRNGKGRLKRPQTILHSGQKAINPRALGTESPSIEVPFLFGWSKEEWSTTEVPSILGIGIFPRSRLL
jgi:hypothetical protein